MSGNTPTDIAERVAARLGLPPDAPDVIDATDAAIALATVYVYGSAAVVNPLALTLLDLDDPRHVQGLVGLAVTLAKAPDSPAGMLESDTFPGTVMPGDPMAAVHHLFDHSRDMAGTVGIA